MTCVFLTPWWRHQMETFSALLALCAGSSPVTGEFPITKASDAELWCFLRCAPEQRIEYTNRGASDLSNHGTHYDVTVIPRLWKMVPCLDVVRDLFTRTDVDWLVLRYLACLFTIECVLQEPQLAMGKNFLFYLFIYLFLLVGDWGGGGGGHELDMFGWLVQFHVFLKILSAFVGWYPNMLNLAFYFLFLHCHALILEESCELHFGHKCLVAPLRWAISGNNSI